MNDKVISSILPLSYSGLFSEYFILLNELIIKGIKLYKNGYSNSCFKLSHQFVKKSQ